MHFFIFARGAKLSPPCVTAPAGFALALALLAPGPASAQTPTREDAPARTREAARLHRVEVHARHAQEAAPLPAAATPIDGAELERDHRGTLSDLADRVPNLRLGGLGGRAGQHFVALRGFINPWSAPEAAVALRIDGVNLSDPLSFDQRLLDIERIDVLAGPQGSRVGANAEAGVIDLVTRRPGDATRAFASVGAGTRGGFEASAGASGAIAENLYGSFAALRDGNDGDIDNLVGAKPYNAQRDRNARGRLIWQAAENAELELLLLDRRSNDRGGEIYLPVDLASFNALPTLGGLPLGKFDQAIDHAGFNRIDATLAALTARWNGEAAKWSAQFSTRRSDATNSTDYDLSPQPWFVMDSRWRVHERQAELRAESADAAAAWQWLAGANIDRRDIDTFRLFNAGPTNPWQLPAGAYVRTDTRLPDRTQALFGETSVALDDAQRWRLGAGARLHWAQRELDFGANAVGAPAANPQSAYRQFLPKLSLEFRATPQATLYATLGQGGKPGGFNPGTFAAAQASYAAERMFTAELGARGGNDQFDWRVAAFDNRVHDYQELTFAETEFTTYLRNVHRASLRGVEAQANARAGEHWRVGGSVGTVRARYDDDVLDPATGFGLDGHRLPQVPRWNARLDAEFRSGPWFARAEWAAAGDYTVNTFNAAANTLRESTVPGYRVTNLGAGWRGEHWSLTAWAHNLADRRYFTSAGYGFAAVALYPGAVGSLGERRTIGATLRWEL